DNFRVLYKPNNNMYIVSNEVIENSLIDLHGTLLFVSHDLYFINRLATKVLEIGPDGTTLYLGDYDYYLHKKEELYEQQLAAEQAGLEKNGQATHNNEASNDKAANSWVDCKEIKRQTRNLEREIEADEKKISETEKNLKR